MKLSEEDLSKLNLIKDKRPSVVIQHIIKNGYITTEELTRVYGYEHAPRAARDVRERGVNLETYRVKSSDGSIEIWQSCFCGRQSSKDSRAHSTVACIEKSTCR